GRAGGHRRDGRTWPDPPSRVPEGGCRLSIGRRPSPISLIFLSQFPHPDPLRTAKKRSHPSAAPPVVATSGCSHRGIAKAGNGRDACPDKKPPLPWWERGVGVRGPRPLRVYLRALQA